jgi:hypothetical protein
MLEQIEKLAAAGIELIPAADVTTHFIFQRDGFVALVERREEGFGAIGTAGLLAGPGMAPLVDRGGRLLFVAKGFEQEATPEQVDALRRFSADLKQALS